LKLGQTVKKADIPERSQITTLGAQEGCCWDSAGAGIFLFAPFLAQLNIDNVLK